MSEICYFGDLQTAPAEPGKATRIVGKTSGFVILMNVGCR